MTMLWSYTDLSQLGDTEEGLKKGVHIAGCSLVLQTNIACVLP